MKFAIVKVNGHYRATFNYDDIEVKEDNFTRGGQQITLYINCRIVAIVYGRICNTVKPSGATDIEETIIEIAE